MKRNLWCFMALQMKGLCFSFAQCCISFTLLNRYYPPASTPPVPQYSEYYAIILTWGISFEILCVIIPGFVLELIHFTSWNGHSASVYWFQWRNLWGNSEMKFYITEFFSVIFFNCQNDLERPADLLLSYLSSFHSKSPCLIHSIYWSWREFQNLS